ncbi:hypothetical protein TrRE_jg10201, partial [Triparma retinervis]
MSLPPSLFVTARLGMSSPLGRLIHTSRGFEDMGLPDISTDAL